MPPHRRSPGHFQRDGGRHAPQVARVPPEDRRRHHHGVQRSEFRHPLPPRSSRRPGQGQPRRRLQAPRLSSVGTHPGRTGQDARNHVLLGGLRAPGQRRNYHRRPGHIRHAPVHAAQPQAQLVHSQLGVRRIPRPAEGGRPPFHHFRSAERDRRGQAPPRHLLPQGRAAPPEAHGQVERPHQLRRDGPRHGRSRILPHLEGAADQGLLDDLAQVPEREAPGSDAQQGPGRRRVGRGVRGSDGPRSHQELLRGSHRHVGLRFAVPVHHAGLQPVLLDLGQSPGRAEFGLRRVQEERERERVCALARQEGHFAHHSGGAPLRA
mmetsp:Transcript_52124/g.156444  ORF Transcript_52124/g.156444 Transcript_52124/m.156444 type:complete len:321 (+) Transcript_52124:1382-2344(+)